MALTCGALGLAPKGAKGRMKMKMTFLTILGSALLVTVTVQLAAATEHKDRRAVRAPTPVSEPFRDSNASWPAPAIQVDNSRYYGGRSAPAGR